MLLWLSDARGIYIPRDFALSFADRAKSVTGVDQETWETLERGPTDEWYWEAWESVLGYARIHDPKWGEYRVYQDGDCWLIPNGMDYDEETDSFVWPEVKQVDDDELALTLHEMACESAGVRAAEYAPDQEDQERQEAERQIEDEISEANRR